MIGMLGILLGAGYMLWTLQRVYLGTLPDKWKNLKDLDGRELAMLIPLAIITIVLGIFPSLVLNIMTTSVNTLVEFLATTLN